MQNTSPKHDHRAGSVLVPEEARIVYSIANVIQGKLQSPFTSSFRYYC